jgi:hypothetical protein
MPPKTLFAAAILAVLSVQHADAARREATLPGTALSVDSPCARHVDITQDPALHSQIAITATADHEEELARLVMEAGAQVQLRTVRDGCWQPIPLGPFRPTLTLSVRVPAGTAVSIDESGAGAYTVGAIAGPLRLDLSGAATIDAQAVTSLHADISGEASVDVAKADGKADIALSGHGRVSVGEASMPTLAVDLSGAGSVSVARGHIGLATLNESGFGKISVGGEVGAAKVDLSGAGIVHFDRVTGSLEKDVSGAGTVSVGE